MRRRFFDILFLTLLFALPSQAKFKVVNYDVQLAKATFDRRIKAGILESTEGIWRASNGKFYAIERFEDERFPDNLRYRVIQLAGKDAEPGMVDYFLELTNHYDHYRIWGHNPFSPANAPVGRENYTYFTPDSFIFAQGLKYIKFVRQYPRIREYSPEELSAGTGSGFAITTDGHIVTNNHVVEHARSITVTGINGNFDKGYRADVILTDPQNDLAIIKVTDTAFTGFGSIPYNIRHNNPLEGESCFAIGYPQGTKLGYNPKITSGIISATTDINRPYCCQISTPVDHGSSGGPLFDENGNILGIICAGYEGLFANLAVKTSYLHALIRKCGITPPGTPGAPGRPLPEMVATNKNFTTLIGVNIDSFETIRELLKSLYIIEDFTLPTDKLTPILEAEQLFVDGRYNEAISMLTDMLTENPKNFDAYMLRGRCWGKLQQYTNSMIDYNQALRNYNKKAENRYSLAIIYRNMAATQFEMKNLDGTIEYAQKALKEEPDHNGTILRMGIAYYYKEDYKKAIKILSGIIEKQGEHQALTSFYRGLSYGMLGNDKKALFDIKDAARLGCTEAEKWLQTNQ